MTQPDIIDPNPRFSFTDGVLGRFKWYRRWTGGYWWRSEYVECWFRHEPTPERIVEDYR